MIAVAANSLLDRAFGKPKVAEEKDDDMAARLAAMSRPERLALMEEMLESVQQYLPAAQRQRRIPPPAT